MNRNNSVMDLTIFHNPRCSKSRATLELLEQRGLEPTIVRYLDDPPDTDTLRQLLSMLGMSPRDLMRKGEPDYSAQRLDDPSLGEDELVQALHDFPKLIERPIVIADGQARIGRPPESVLDIL